MLWNNFLLQTIVILYVVITFTRLIRDISLLISYNRSCLIKYVSMWLYELSLLNVPFTSSKVATASKILIHTTRNWCLCNSHLIIDSLINWMAIVTDFPLTKYHTISKWVNTLSPAHFYESRLAALSFSHAILLIILVIFYLRTLICESLNF